MKVTDTEPGLAPEPPEDRQGATSADVIGGARDPRRTEPDLAEEVPPLPSDPKALAAMKRAARIYQEAYLAQQNMKFEGVPAEQGAPDNAGAGVPQMRDPLEDAPTRPAHVAAPSVGPRAAARSNRERVEVPDDHDDRTEVTNPSIARTRKKNRLVGIIVLVMLLGGAAAAWRVLTRTVDSRGERGAPVSSVTAAGTPSVRAIESAGSPTVTAAGEARVPAPSVPPTYAVPAPSTSTPAPRRPAALPRQVPPSGSSRVRVRESKTNSEFPRALREGAELETDTE